MQLSRRKQPSILLTVLTGLLASGASAARASDVPTLWTDQQKEEFLRKAEVVRIEDLKVGVTGSQRATLKLGEHIHDAHVQTIDIAKPKFKVGAQTEVNFRDSYKFNVAAYRLDRMLELGMVPVSVLARYKRQKAAFTWWIEDVQMTERDRVAKNIPPPRLEQWQDQLDRALVFDQLVYNTDFNRSNLLITDDWTMWLVDFTRAFRVYRRLREPEKLRRIDADLLERLRALDRQKLKQRLEDVLTGPEVRGVLARRDEIVELFERRIDTQGADAILYRSE